MGRHPCRARHPGPHFGNSLDKECTDRGDFVKSISEVPAPSARAIRGLGPCPPGASRNSVRRVTGTSESRPGTAGKVVAMRVMLATDGSAAAAVASAFVADRTWPADTTIDVVAVLDLVALLPPAPFSPSPANAAAVLEGFAGVRAARRRSEQHGRSPADARPRGHHHPADWQAGRPPRTPRGRHEGSTWWCAAAAARGS